MHRAPPIRALGPLLAAIVLIALGAIAVPGSDASAAAPPASSSASSAPAKTWHPRIRAARRYAQHRAGRVSFDVIDTNGRERGFHPRRTAPAASVFKVMLLVAYLRGPAHRRGLHRSERRLLSPMIRRSDSVAATRVCGILGVGAINRLAHRAGMRHFSYRATWGLSRTNPRDQARFMRRFDRLVPARHRSYARHLLAGIVRPQRWGIGRVRLHGWRLYFKGGWGSGSGRVDHQVALLAGGGRRISLAIFTEFDPSHGYGKHTLRGVAARLLRGLPPPSRG